MKNKLPIFILCMFCLLAYGQRFVKVANNLAELALLNPNDIHTNAFVAGGAVAGDGNGGVFSYIKTSSTATTAVDVIKPVSYAGRWLRSIPGLNNTNGSGATYQTIYTNVISITNHTDYVTNGSPIYITNGPTLITQNYQTNVNITNLFFNVASRGTEQITGTNAVVNFTNQFLKRWILPGNSAPVFASIPSGTNETQVQVDVVQPVGAAYTITWPESINWRKNSGYELLEQDTTNTFIFQWNGEGLSGWLVDGDANSAFLASGGLVQANGDAVDFVMTYDTWVDAQFNGGPFSVTITNNGPYAIYYNVDVQAANTQTVGVQIYDGTNVWPGLSGWVTVQSVEMPMTKIITTNVTTAPVTLTMQVYNIDGGMMYANAYLVGTNAVLGYHLLGGSGSGGITYTTVTNALNLTTGYLPYATSATTLGDSPWYRISTNRLNFNSNTTNGFLVVPNSSSLGLGSDALLTTTTGVQNTMVGNSAGPLITTGEGNSGFGYASIQHVADGNYNTGVGDLAMQGNTSSGNNVAVGYAALQANGPYSDNTAAGFQSLYWTTGGQNVGVGSLAGFTNTTSTTSVYIGYDANPKSATGENNQIVIGANAVGNGANTTVIGNTNTVSAHIIASGYTGAGTNYLSDDGTYKAGSGLGTTINPTDGYLPYRTSATSFGDSPWYRISTNAMGFNGTNWFVNTATIDSLSIGDGAMPFNTDVFGREVAIGTRAATNRTAGFQGTFVGYEAGKDSIANNVTAIGANAGTTAGESSTAVGYAALGSGTATGSVALGQSALNAATGNSSVAIGVNALATTTTGTELVGIGYYAGFSNTVGSGSVLIGKDAAFWLTNATDVIAIGLKAAAVQTAQTHTNAIVIGSYASLRGDNTAQIGTNGITVLYLNGTVGWFRGTGSPEAATTATVGSTFTREDGSGTLYKKTDGTGNTGWETVHSGNTAYLAANATSVDTTMANLSMSATVINAKKYSFVLTIFCANSTPADGIKIDFEGGSATATNFRAHAITHDTALAGSQQTSALATDFTVATITGDSEMVVKGSFEPSASGTFIPRFAENADTGGTLTVYRGSNLILTEIP